MNGDVCRDDFRYEIRDAQYAAGLLVDEGIADRNRIGAQGESYGAVASLGLATLNDRVMNADGTLSPWTSPKGAPLHTASAAPVGPDGAVDVGPRSLPNGRCSSDTQTTATNRTSPQSGCRRCQFGRGLFTVGMQSLLHAQPAATPT